LGRWGNLKTYFTPVSKSDILNTGKIGRDPTTLSNVVSVGTNIVSEIAFLLKGKEEGMRIKPIVLCLVLVLMATSAYAAGQEYVEGAGNKLVRGFINAITGWVELPVQIYKGYNQGFMGNESNKAVGAIAGIFKGIGHSAGRTISGVSDVAGFWAADNKSNEGVGIPLDAEYAWEEGSAYNMFEPDLTEGAIKPMGNKLLRGLGNAIFGFVEFPGQIVKGVKEKAPDIGLVKGIWYAFSRPVTGAYEATTFLLPNPVDTKALAFEEEWPWDALMGNMQ